MTGIVVVTYNSSAVIGACLDSCLRFDDVQVTVVDNASIDGTVAIVRSKGQVGLIANRVNRGFAAAANQGIEASSSGTVLLLNPDTELQSGLALLSRATLGPGVGAVGGKLTNTDGSAQAGFNVRGFPKPLTLAFEVLGLNRIWPKNPVNRQYRHTLPVRLTEVDQPAGAFLMIRRSAYRAVGGFDEAFFPIWFEDVDFCKRLRSAGYCVLYEPAAVATHAGGHSAGRLSWEVRQLFWYGSLLRYACKHFSIASRRGLSLALMFACLPRMIERLAVTRSFEPVTVYSRVILLALGYLREGACRTPDPIAGRASRTKSGSVEM